MSELNTFGDRLQARMKEMGWSMPRLGKGLKAKKGGILDGDIGRAAVFGWINGAGFPNVIQLAEICRRLNISADYLVFGHRQSMSPRVELAKTAIQQLSQEEREELHNMLGSAPADDATVERRMPITRNPPSPSPVHAKAGREITPDTSKSQTDTSDNNQTSVQEWVTKEQDGSSGKRDTNEDAEPRRERSKGR